MPAPLQLINGYEPPYHSAPAATHTLQRTGAAYDHTLQHNGAAYEPPGVLRGPRALQLMEHAAAAQLRQAEVEQRRAFLRQLRSLAGIYGYSLGYVTAGARGGLRAAGVCALNWRGRVEVACFRGCFEPDGMAFAWGLRRTRALGKFHVAVRREAANTVMRAGANGELDVTFASESAPSLANGVPALGKHHESGAATYSMQPDSDMQTARAAPLAGGQPITSARPAATDAHARASAQAANGLWQGPVDHEQIAPRGERQPVEALEARVARASAQPVDEPSERRVNSASLLSAKQHGVSHGAEARAAAVANTVPPARTSPPRREQLQQQQQQQQPAAVAGRGEATRAADAKEPPVATRDGAAQPQPQRLQGGRGALRDRLDTDTAVVLRRASSGHGAEAGRSMQRARMRTPDLSASSDERSRERTPDATLVPTSAPGVQHRSPPSPRAAAGTGSASPAATRRDAAAGAAGAAERPRKVASTAIVVQRPAAHRSGAGESRDGGQWSRSSGRGSGPEAPSGPPNARRSGAAERGPQEWNAARGGKRERPRDAGGWGGPGPRRRR